MDLSEIFNDGALTQDQFVEKLGDKKLFTHSENEIPGIISSQDVDGRVTSNFFPKDKFNALNDEKKNFETMYNNSTAKITELSEKAEKGSDWEKELNDYKTQSELDKTELIKTNERNLKRANLATMFIGIAGENTELIMATYFNTDESIDNVPMVNNQIVGFEELKKPIVEKHKSLFSKDSFIGKPPVEGEDTDDPSISGLTDQDKKVAKTTGMSEKSIAEMKKDDKEKYDKLIKRYGR